MKVLVIAAHQDPEFKIPATFSTLGLSSPYGFDTIIVDTSNLGNMLGQNSGNIAEVWQRWHETLKRWLVSGHRIIVTMHPRVDSNGWSNYGWMPLEGFNEANLVPCGSNKYIGSIVAQDSYVKQFLKTDHPAFNVVTHYKDQPHDDHIKVNSKVDDYLYTSFTWRDGDSEVIFIPQTSLGSLNGMVGAFESASNKWKVPAVKGLEEQIQLLDDQLEAIEQKRSKLSAEMTAINLQISSLISSDVYLSSAIKSYELTQGTENPDPDNFYEAIEAIENAFKSEKEMRETLDFSKAYINKLMRRTNEFRHSAKSGNEPSPLAESEIAEFTKMTEKIIAAYIDYLYTRERGS